MFVGRQRVSKTRQFVSGGPRADRGGPVFKVTNGEANQYVKNLASRNVLGSRRKLISVGRARPPAFFGARPSAAAHQADGPRLIRSYHHCRNLLLRPRDRTRHLVDRFLPHSQVGRPIATSQRRCPKMRALFRSADIRSAADALRMAPARGDLLRPAGRGAW